LQCRFSIPLFYQALTLKQAMPWIAERTPFRTSLWLRRTRHVRTGDASPPLSPQINLRLFSSWFFRPPQSCFRDSVVPYNRLRGLGVSPFPARNLPLLRLWSSPSSSPPLTGDFLRCVAPGSIFLLAVRCIALMAVFLSLTVPVSLWRALFSSLDSWLPSSFNPSTPSPFSRH